MLRFLGYNEWEKELSFCGTCQFSLPETFIYVKHDFQIDLNKKFRILYMAQGTNSN